MQTAALTGFFLANCLVFFLVGREFLRPYLTAAVIAAGVGVAGALVFTLVATYETPPQKVFLTLYQREMLHTARLAKRLAAAELEACPPRTGSAPAGPACDFYEMVRRRAEPVTGDRLERFERTDALQEVDDFWTEAIADFEAAQAARGRSSALSPTVVAALVLLDQQYVKTVDAFLVFYRSRRTGDVPTLWSLLLAMTLGAGVGLVAALATRRQHGHAPAAADAEP